MRLPTLLAALLFVAAFGVMAVTSWDRPAPAIAPVRGSAYFEEHFNSATLVRETSTPTRSPSPNWWVDSGAALVVRNGLGSTVLGTASPGYFRTRYSQRNPVDTDNGTHPQNVFRLVTRRHWVGDVGQECYFRVLGYHRSASPQRYEANGLLLFSRYVDANNLYYAGVRVDGHAVVKKKSRGVYYTLAEKPVFPGTYHRLHRPNLLPSGVWIGLRSETRIAPDGSVVVSLFIDRNRTGTWEFLLRGIDAGVGGPPFRTTGATGIRTDFMDVQFDDYTMGSLTTSATPAVPR